MNEVQRLLHDPVFSRLGLTLVQFLWQGLALALAAWFLRALLHRARPALRYLVLLGLFAAMAAAPVLTFTLWTKAPPPAVMTQADMGKLLAAAARQRELRLPLLGIPGAGHAVESHPSVLISARDWMRRAWRWARSRLPLVGLLWMAGVLVLSGRLLVQWGLFLRVLRRAALLDGERWRRLLASLSERIGVPRVVRLVQSLEVGMPTAAGWLRPVILLPPAVLLGLTPEQLEAVLAHELAHIRRHDFLVNVAQRVVEVLLFHSPAVWWVSGLIRVERELCCDDLALSACGNAVSYARALRELEELRWRAPEPALTATRGPVTARVRRLVLPVEAGRRPLSWSTVLSPLLALTIVCLISGLAPVGGAPYIRGTLMYGEAAPAIRHIYWEWGGDRAKVIRGRSQWAVRDAAPFHLWEYSPTGDEVLFPQPNADLEGVPREEDPTDIWKAKLDWLGRPDLAHAVNLIARAGIGRGDNGTARWSPDGRRIMLRRCPYLGGGRYSVDRELWVMNSDGSGAHQIRVPGRIPRGAAEWASDSSHIVLTAVTPNPPRDVSCRSEDCRGFISDLDGTHLRELPLKQGVMSPDGRWIAGVRADPVHGVIPVNAGKGWYKPSTGAYRWELLLVPPDGQEEGALLSGSRPLADLPADPCNTAVLLTPHDLAWSPDGRQIAFVAALNWDPKGLPVNRQVELFIYDLPSGRLTQVTHDDLEQCTPAWME